MQREKTQVCMSEETHLNQYYRTGVLFGFLPERERELPFLSPGSRGVIVSDLCAAAVSCL